MDLQSWLIIIPARLESSRLAEKPLQDLKGKPLVVRVAENLSPLAAAGAKILVATDAEKVRKVCAEHHLDVVLTSTLHQSGTDRCFEASQICGGTFQYVMNVQGDEPFINPDDLKGLAEYFEHCSHPMGTMVHRNESKERFNDANCVKAVLGENQQAIFFSRSPVPYQRDQMGWPGHFWQHVGVYVFKKERLKEFCSLKKTELEKTESLEQLRALSHGWTIGTIEATSSAMGIDTPEDLKIARDRLDR